MALTHAVSVPSVSRQTLPVGWLSSAKVKNA